MYMYMHKLRLETWSSFRFFWVHSRDVVLKKEVWERRSHPTTPLI